METENSEGEMRARNRRRLTAGVRRSVGLLAGAGRSVARVVALALLFGLAHASPAAAACGEWPAVTTDKADYGPTEIVTISGSGFECGALMSVLVTAPDGSTLSGDGSGSPGPDFVTVDQDGAFVLSYQLFGTLPDGGIYQGQSGSYAVDVLGVSGTVVASATFSDSQGYFSCALTTSGGVKCWGDNFYGSLGNGTFQTSSPYGSALPVDVSGLSSGVVQVTVGYQHACALTTSGGVKCWGHNLYGQLGTGMFQFSDPKGSAVPVDVIGLSSGVVQVSAGYLHTCAVLAAGGVKCWGYGGDGRLGTGSSSSSAVPVPVSGLTDVAQVSAGADHTCAVLIAGVAKCWGFNNNGQLGTGALGGASAVPVPVSGLIDVTQVSAGLFHTCAVVAGGAKCWGYNAIGQLGNGTFPPPWESATPVDVYGLTSGVAQVSAGYYHTCALTVAGGAACWGWNAFGQLGTGTAGGRSVVPVEVTGLTSGVAQISAGRFHACALTTNGGAKCWGWNREGQLGSGSFATADPWGTATPGDVSGLTSGVAKLWDGEPSVGADTAPPVIDCDSPDGLWHNDNVALSCMAADAGSGLANAADAAFTLGTSLPAGQEWADVATVSRQVCDAQNNCATAGPISGNKIDRKAPWVGITAPSAGDSVTLGAVALATYGCQDDGSGLASCAGPVASGGAIDTASAGPKTFTVVGTDNVGHGATASASYSVSYGVCLAYDPTKAHKAGSTYPLKIRLCDVHGNNVSSASITVTALSVFFVSTQIDGELADSGNANPDFNFRFDDGQYIFNLSLKGFQTGTYGLRFTAGTDPKIHVIEFQVK